MIIVFSEHIDNTRNLTDQLVCRRLPFMYKHYISNKSQIDPIKAQHGEIVYELIGRADKHGGADGHSLAYVNLPPGKASLAHHHKRSEESYYILSGEARLVVDGHSYPMSTDDTCLILPGQVHQIFNDSSSDLDFLAVCVPPWEPSDSVYIG